MTWDLKKKLFTEKKIFFVELFFMLYVICNHFKEKKNPVATIEILVAATGKIPFAITGFFFSVPNLTDFQNHYNEKLIYIRNGGCLKPYDRFRTLFSARVILDYAYN